MRKKFLFSSILVILTGLITISVATSASKETSFDITDASSKTIELYRTTSFRLSQVSGKDYKRCHLNTYTDLLFTNSTNYTEKDESGKYKYYCTIEDGGKVWKRNLDTYGGAANSLSRIKVTYTAIDADAYIECLTDFDSQTEYGLTPQSADLSYVLDSAVNTYIAGNYFTLIAHGDLLLNAIYISYGCDVQASKSSEVISCGDVNLDVNESIQLNPTSSFGDSVSFTYQSANPSIATVDSSGVVTTVSLGSTTITITSSLGNSKQINVDVSGQVYATLLNDNRVFSGNTGTAYPGTGADSLNVSRKGTSNAVYNHIYYKFDASDILSAYNGLSTERKNNAKIHLRIYAYDSLANFTSADISTMAVRGYNPATLLASTSDSDHGSCQMIDWDPTYVTWANVNPKNNIQGYEDIARNTGSVIAFDSTSTLDCENKILDLYFPYASFASYIYQGQGAYNGYVTIAFDYSNSDKSHDNFTVYTSRTAFAPSLSLISYEDVRPSFDEADVFIYMGQSNMAGRGEAVDSLPCTDHGYEYLSVTGTPGHYLTNLVEPFGKLENNEALADGDTGDGKKTGSVVSSFVEGYYSITGIPVIGVSASVGATSITQWQSGSVYLEEAKRRLKACIDYIEQEEDFTVRHINMVWCQGEADASKYVNGTLDYFGKLQGMVDDMKSMSSKYAIEKCYIIPPSLYSSNELNNNKLILANDQIDYCTNHSTDFALASKKYYDVPLSMRDDPHFHQGIYNVTGYDAGIHVGQIIESLQVSPYNAFISGQEITLAAQYGITLTYHT